MRHARPCAGHPRLALLSGEDVDGRDNKRVHARLRRAMPGHDGVDRPQPSTKTASMTQAQSSADLARYLLAPRSLAIVGQSNDAGKTAGRPLKYLRQAGYAGRLYPINPGRDTVLGERAWPSLAALPEVPEHVYVVTPTDASVEAVAE